MRHLVYFAALFCLSGCTFPLLHDRIGTREFFIHDRNNLFCLNSLDTTPLSARIGQSQILPDSELIAGYDNILFPGRDPFPCNTSHSTLFTGRVSFSAPQDFIDEVNRNGGVLGATLLLDRRSSGIPIVARDISPRPRGNDRCRFVLIAPLEDWPSGYERDGDFVNFGESTGVISGGEEILASFTNSDFATSPIRISSSRFLRLVKDWTEGRRENLGLEIRPDPSNPEVFRGLSNATCLGIFSNPILELVVPRSRR